MLQRFPSSGELNSQPAGGGDSDDEDTAAIARLFSIGSKRKRSASDPKDTMSRTCSAEAVSIWPLHGTLFSDLLESGVKWSC